MNEGKSVSKGNSTPAKTEDEDRDYQELKNKLTALEATVQFFPGQSASKVMSKLLFGCNGEAAEKSLQEGLKHQHRLLKQGNLSGIEAMLLDQAFVLNAVFNRYISSGTQSQQLDSFQKFCNAALKAQNQCRNTLATLIDLRSPKRPATFIKQQNVGINQQINGGGAPLELSKRNEKYANELLEVNHDERLDAGAAQESINSNTTLEPMAKVNRPTH